MRPPPVQPPPCRAAVGSRLLLCSVAALGLPCQRRPWGKGRSGRPEVWGDRSEIRERGNYFLAINVYLPSSSDSLSIQMTVHLPSPLNFAFTAPFFVSYTAHTSSDFSETDHS